MNKFAHGAVVGAFMLLGALIAPNPASAQYQNYYDSYNSGDYGRMRQTNWQVQQGIHTQHPGATIAGALLSGLGQGLYQENSGRNAVAGNVLHGLGQGLTIASQPTYWQQGAVQQMDQGYFNHRRGEVWGQRPW